MDLITALSRTIPFAFASGLNLYATVAVIGLSSRFDLVQLPGELEAFEHPVVIGVALSLYAIEFVADKIPWVDTVWDAVHTIIRPLGGAFLAVATLGEASPAAVTAAALLGGSVAAVTHLTKAGTRAAANTSPEPLSNWALSLGEDVLAIGLSYVALQHPMLALIVALTLLGVMMAFAVVLVRLVRRRFARKPEV
jgi:hypothetical protein